MGRDGGGVVAVGGEARWLGIEMVVVEGKERGT